MPSGKTSRQQLARRLIMLVLSRNSHQKIVFPTLGISVEILKIKGNKVRVGINAPTSVPVHRSEVAERMFREGLRHERPR